MATLINEVGSAIKQLRLDKGLTQKEAGELLGMSEANFNRYESGKQNLTLDSVEKIAKAFNVVPRLTFVKA